MSTESKWSRGARAELLALAASGFAAVCAWLIWGFRVGISNNEFHYPILLLQRHATNFQGDALASSLGHFASPLWSLLARIPPCVPIPTILLTCFLVSRALLAWAVGLLVSAFTPDSQPTSARLVGALATIASGWMLQLPLGTDPMVGTYFSHTFLSVGLLIAALGFFFRDKHVVAALLLGIAYDVNLMQANFAAGILVCGWLFGNGLHRKSVLATLKYLVFVGIAGLPGLLQAAAALATKSTAPSLTGSALADFAAFHIPGHFFWAMKSPFSQLQAASLMCLPPLLIWIHGRLGRSRAFPWLVALPIAYALAHLALLTFAPSRFLFQLHLFRSDVFSYALAASLALAAVMRSLATKDSARTAFWTAISMLLLTHNFFPALVLGLSLLLSTRLPRRYALPASAFLFVASLGWMKLTGFPSTAMLATIITAPCGWGLLETLPRRARLITTGYSLALASLVLVIGFRFWHLDLHPADETARTLHSRNYDNALLAAKQATLPNAVFTVPPSMNTRPRLERGVYYSIWDGAGFLWNKGHELEVLRRMRVLGIEYTPGIQYQAEVIDQQWANGVCRASSLLAAEGVTHAIVPVLAGRISLAANEYQLVKIDADSIQALCSLELI